MLSYQHSYHAGGLADVHKHAALAYLLSAMVGKGKPLTYMESHAGRGVYNLASKEAEKTQEARYGIQKTLRLSRIPPHHPYKRVLDRAHLAYGKNAYPGSPYIAKNLLTTGDTLHFMELHPQEFLALKAAIKSPHIHIHKRDGYEGTLSLSPPSSHRGIVFIDPNYEIKSEYSFAVGHILKLLKKWPEAIILLWYPILEAANHIPMCKKLQDARLPKFWQQEILFSDKGKLRMQGSGLIAINLPFGIEKGLEEVRNFF